MIANLVGLSIVLTAIQFYRDVDSAMNHEDSFLRRDFLVVSKQIGITDRATGFTPEEIEDLQSQPWVENIGRFTPSLFKAAISVEFQGHGMSSETFFESIPDSFFDRLPDGWGFDPDNPVVPIILSRDYLSLYNFGFASSRGLPKFRESEIGLVPLTIAIQGNGHYTRVKGYIAGFSSRISTIAVPEDFMKWANATFAPQYADVDPSRLVIEVNNPGDPAIKRYMSSHALEIAGDKIDNSQASYFLSVLTAVVIGVGTIISLLAFFILMLSIYLLLQKNREKLHDLMLLGYSPRQVGKYYYRIVILANSLVLVLSIAVMLVARTFWSDPLRQLDMEPTTPLVPVAVGLAISLLTTGINLRSIRRIIRRNF